MMRSRAIEMRPYWTLSGWVPGWGYGTRSSKCGEYAGTAYSMIYETAVLVLYAVPRGTRGTENSLGRLGIPRYDYLNLTRKYILKYTDCEKN